MEGRESEETPATNETGTENKLILMNLHSALPDCCAHLLPRFCVVFDVSRVDPPDQDKSVSPAQTRSATASRSRRRGQEKERERERKRKKEN